MGISKIIKIIIIVSILFILFTNSVFAQNLQLQTRDFYARHRYPGSGNNGTIPVIGPTGSFIGCLKNGSFIAFNGVNFFHECDAGRPQCVYLSGVGTNCHSSSADSTYACSALFDHCDGSYCPGNNAAVDFMDGLSQSGISSSVSLFNSRLYMNGGWCYVEHTYRVQYYELMPPPPDPSPSPSPPAPPDPYIPPVPIPIGDCDICELYEICKDWFDKFNDFLNQQLANLNFQLTLFKAGIDIPDLIADYIIERNNIINNPPPSPPGDNPPPSPPENNINFYPIIPYIDLRNIVICPTNLFKNDTNLLDLLKNKFPMDIIGNMPSPSYNEVRFNLWGNDRNINFFISKLWIIKMPIWIGLLVYCLIEL